MSDQSEPVITSSFFVTSRPGRGSLLCAVLSVVSGQTESHILIYIYPKSVHHLRLLADSGEDSNERGPALARPQRGRRKCLSLAGRG